MISTKIGEGEVKALKIAISHRGKNRINTGTSIQERCNLTSEVPFHCLVIVHSKKSNYARWRRPKGRRLSNEHKMVFKVQVFLYFTP